MNQKKIQYWLNNKINIYEGICSIFYKCDDVFYILKNRGLLKVWEAENYWLSFFDFLIDLYSNLFFFI